MTPRLSLKLSISNISKPKFFLSSHYLLYMIHGLYKHALCQTTERTSNLRWFFPWLKYNLEKNREDIICSDQDTLFQQLICHSVVVSIHHSSTLQLQRSQVNLLHDKFQKGHLQIANKFSLFNPLGQYAIYFSFCYEGSPKNCISSRTAVFSYRKYICRSKTISKPSTQNMPLECFELTATVYKLTF